MSSAEESVACPCLDHGERPGLIKQLPHLEELDRQQRAEGWVDGWAGVVVAARADSLAGRVVAAAWVIQRQAHELGEGYGASGGNALAYFGFGSHGGLIMMLSGVLYVTRKEGRS